MNNGEGIPAMAFGTYQIKDEEMNDVLPTVLNVGYRHLDCAWIYHNEKSIGNVLQEKFQRGDLKRSDLFITSKLWSSFHRFQRVEQQCLITIDHLQCQYLDLFLIHWPIAFQDEDPNDEEQCSIDIDDEIDLIQSWKAMEMLVDQGLVKSIGLSNFNQEQIEEILRICKYKPVLNQVEIHPYCPQYDLEEFCRKHDILLAGYAPLGGTQNNPFIEENAPILLKDPIIASLAKKYQCQPSDILLRFILDRNLICIVKSSNHQRIQKNFQLFQQSHFHLNDQDYQLIKDQIRIRYRYYTMKDGIRSKYHPFPHWTNILS